MQELKFQVQHYILEMWRRRWSILIVLWLVGTVGGYLAAKQPDVYTSRATVFVDTNALLKAVLGPRTFIEDQSEIINNVRKSMFARPVIEEVIRDTDQHLDIKDQRDWEMRVADLTDQLVLKRQGRDYYLIQYLNEDPQTARDVVQSVLDKFIENVTLLTTGSDTDEQTRAVVERDLNAASDKLGDLRARIAAFEREHGEVLTGAAVSTEINGLEAEVGRLEADRLLYREEIQTLQARLAGLPPQIVTGHETPVQPQRDYIPPPVRPTAQPLPQVQPVPQALPVPQIQPLPQLQPTLEEQQYQAFLPQIAGVQGQVDSLLQRLTPQHPDVIAATQRLQQLQGEAQRLRLAAEQAGGSQRAAAERAVASQRAAADQVQRQNAAAIDQVQRQNAAAIAQVQQQNAAAEARYQQEYNEWLRISNAPLPQLQPQPVYAANPQIPELRAQIAQRENRRTVTNARLADIRKEVSRLQVTLSQQPKVLQDYAELKREETKSAASVESLESDLDKVLLAGNTGVSLVELRTIEPPQVPVTPAGPNRLILFVAAALLALGAAAGQAFFRAQLADNIPSITKLKRQFDLPILGGVSLMESRGQTMRNAMSSIVFVAGVAAFLTFFAFVTYRHHFDLWRPLHQEVSEISAEQPSEHFG